MAKTIDLIVAAGENTLVILGVPNPLAHQSIELVWR